MAGKSLVYLLLVLITMYGFVSCKDLSQNGTSANKTIHKRIRIFQNPFIPFAIPIVVSEEYESGEGGRKREANNEDNFESEEDNDQPKVPSGII